FCFYTFYNIGKLLDLSKRQAYSSLSPTVHIVNVQNALKQSHANSTLFIIMQDIHEGLNFSAADDESSFGIFSIKFSKDGREIAVGNSNESICIYDLGANKVTEADVNAVTFADESSDVLYSGSDDSLCKVWDRRCHKRTKPVGVLAGHLDGVTFIDSRGDGHYFISNCKDQTIKLWDIRKLSSATKDCTPKAYEWDYRWMTYPSEARFLKHPYDQSLATFRGHSVLRTLIRCHFSPMHRSQLVWELLALGLSFL
uniref:Uncharacterized protein n=1 Tax=Aegilops tauschii subsp. strangulata TaxID=200361 RepID=A0A452XTY3_AEGTS